MTSAYTYSACIQLVTALWDAKSSLRYSVLGVDYRTEELTFRFIPYSIH